MTLVLSTGEETFNRKHEPRVWLVPGLFTHGLTLLSARPKAGKSALMRSLAASVAIGAAPLGTGDVGRPGDVLYIDWENGDEVNHQKLQEMFPGDNHPDFGRITFAYHAPRFPALWDAINNWHKAAGNPTLVVVDVYGNAKQVDGVSRHLLAPDVDNLTLRPLHQWANQNRVCVVALTHNRSGREDPDDILGSVLGSTAMTGTPDVVMILKKDAREVRTLHVAGRPLQESQHVTLQYDMGWITVAGEVDALAASSTRQAIVSVLREHGRLSPQDVADLLSKPGGTVRAALLRMKLAGEVEAIGAGKNSTYHLPGWKSGGTVTETSKRPENPSTSIVAPAVSTEVVTPSGNGGNEAATDHATALSRSDVTGIVDSVTDEGFSTPSKTETSDVEALSPKEGSDGAKRTSDAKHPVEDGLLPDQEYLLNWLRGFGGTATHREAQQRCSPALTGSAVATAAAQLAEGGLLEIEEQGKKRLYRLTEAGRAAAMRIGEDPNQMRMF